MPKYVVTQEKIILLRVLLFIFARVLGKFLLSCPLPYFFAVSLFFNVGFLIGWGKSDGEMLSALVLVIFRPQMIIARGRSEYGYTRVAQFLNTGARTILNMQL